MHDENKGRYRYAPITSFLLGSLGILCLIVLDKLYWRTGVIEEGWPNFSYGHIIRSVVIFISLCAMFWSLIDRYQPKWVLGDSDGVSIERLSIFLTLLTSILCLFLFLYEPSVFNAISQEDGPIEWGSAILLFSCCFIFVASFVRHRNRVSIPKITQWTFFFFIFVFFIMAMEEISWFQRVLAIETPSLFKFNPQMELNLHNFATDTIENIYYFGAFLFLVVLPFLRVLFSTAINNNYLRLFLPRPFVSIVGAVACAYNFDMWNIIFTQISFFSAVIILFIFALFSSNWSERFNLIFTIVLIVITQAIFLSNGEVFSRLWEVTEYKEFFIPLAFFWYSLSLYNYINKVHFAEL